MTPAATPKRRKPSPAKRKLFTEANVFKLPLKKKQYLIWDGGTGAARGLAILVGPTGTLSFRCVFYYPGSVKPNWKHLGRVGQMTVAEARQECRDARRDASKGIDPKAGAPVSSQEFETAFKNFIQHEQLGRKNNASADNTQKAVLRHCRGWLRRPVATIRYGEIEKLLWLVRDGDKALKMKPHPYMANRLYSHLRDFFAWCARRGTIPASPMATLEKPWSGEKRRERPWFKGTAADDVIAAVWRAADTIGGDDGRYLKLMLVIAKRKTALAAIKWEEIDADWFWNAPPSKSKNKRLHAVPLPKLAQRILSPRADSGPVFSNEIEFDNLLYKVRKLSGVADFIYHGARHIGESKMAQLRVLPHIRDLIFDHVPERGEGATYDHHEYKDEMLDALEKWCAHIERLVTPEGVARLR